MGKTSLKTVLRKFLQYFQEMELSPERYVSEFQSLKELTETLRGDNDYSCNEGLKDVNRRKNRYKDILPYDRTRVTISEYPGVPGSDYINANYVRGSTGSTCAYIASQGPLPNTLVDFWRMIWECDTTVIVMACNESESGKYKCESYWPTTPEEEQQYGNITVKLVKWKNVCPDFMVRTLEIRQEETTRTVIQFHYGTWPDHGVPVAVTPILELVRLMRDVQATETRPILVHCSAGCGRTGTICSIDFVWALLRAGKLQNDFSLYSIIYDMRKQRIAMVQTLEQYVLCYKAVAALFQQQLKIIDAHTYENLDEHGEPLILRSIRHDSHSSESDFLEDLRTDVKVVAEVKKKEDLEIVPPATSVKVNQDNSPTSSLIRRAPSLDSVISSPHNTSSQFQDKLVGKATVFRRPSIAKLKAMFENIQTTDAQNNLEQQRKLKLSRSQSTRERGPTRISIASRSTGLLSVMDISHEAAAVARQAGFRRTASSNDLINDDRLGSQDSSGESEVACAYSSDSSRMRLESQQPKSILKSDTIKSPPPKPPRTYIYGSIVHDRERGRMIARISSRDDARVREEQYQQIQHQIQIQRPLYRNELHHRSQQPQQVEQPIHRDDVDERQLPMISHIPQHVTNPPLVASHHQLHQRNLATFLSNGDLTENSQIQIIHLQGSNPEPIYQTLPVHTITRHHPTPIPYQQQQQNIYGTIGPVRREIHLSHPSLISTNMTLIPSRQPTPSILGNGMRIAAVQRLPPVNGFLGRPMTAFESIYEVPKKRPILSEKGTRPPVTYVRPQPNPRLQAASNETSNSPSSLREGSDPKKTPTEDKNNTDNSKNKKSFPSKEAFKKPSFSLSSLFSRSKPKCQDEKDCQPTTIGKSKKNGERKIKSQSQLHSRSVQNLTSHTLSHISSSSSSGPRSGSVILRPPHSHRFSPPTQWTQV